MKRYPLSVAVDWFCRVDKLPVAILGHGVSGKSCAHWLSTLQIPYEVFDIKDHLLKEADVTRFAFCVYSPGFQPYHPWLKWFYRANIPTIAELDFAALFWKNPLIAVTGTNGKTSVTEALKGIFAGHGYAVQSLGNNGNVATEALCQGIDPRSYLILEVSSFQAIRLRYLNPLCVLWTNIAEDHLTYHRSFKNYWMAKKHLVDLSLRNRGKAFVGSSVKPYLPPHPSLFVADVLPEEDAWFQSFPLSFSRGQQENFHLIRLFCEKAGFDLGNWERCLKRFRQAPHRLTCVRVLDGKEYWNDSKATNLHAVKAALDSLKDRDVYWILGGKSKGESLGNFVSLFDHYQNVRGIYFIGDVGKELFEMFQGKSQLKAKFTYAQTLQNVFNNLPKTLLPYRLVLSPGFSSWDQYQNYEERGDYFQKLVFAL